MSFEEYCKLRNINVNDLDEVQYDDLWVDYFFDCGCEDDSDRYENAL